METNKRSQMHSIRRTGGRGLKPLPIVEDTAWLNDVQPKPRPVQASPSFVGVEQLETVPLTKLTEAKLMASLETSSDKQDILKTTIDHYEDDIGPKHPLWPILLRLSEQLWHETYQSAKTMEQVPSVEHLRQRAVSILRSEPAIASAINGLANAELLIRCLLYELIGYGPLELVMQDEHVSEIIVGSPQYIKVKRDGVLQESAHCFANEQHMQRIIDNMLRRSGSHLHYEKPIIDIVLPPSLPTQTANNAYFTATILLPPISLGGPTLMLRRRPQTTRSLSELIEKGMLSQAMADLLHASVKERRNIVICGEHTTGKTTLLNALSGILPEQEHIVSVEHVSELILQQRGKTSLVANASGPGMVYSASQVMISEVLQRALLLQPAYLLMGECRGEETAQLLGAMYQGQRGVIATLYAKSIRDCLQRLEQQCQCDSRNVTVEMARTRLTHALDILVFLAKEHDGTLRIRNIAKVIGVDKRRIKVRSLFYEQREITELAASSSIEHS